VKENIPSTQKYLDITEIRDGVIIMRDGSLRAVILVSSVNFALKSEEEQNATIQSYISFLNYLEHPVQILTQSRKLNIDKYLNNISEIEKKQTNELLKMQTAEYRQFVKELVDLGEIMSKKFYIVIPYVPGADKKKGLMDRIASIFSPLTNIRLREKRFQELKKDLDTRVGTINSGLNGIGLNIAQLDTQALIELFYNTYNPQVSEQQKISDVGKLQIE